MRKVITFLGTKPIDTTYTYQGTVYHGKVFAEAIRQFVEFDKMAVFVTQEAMDSSWPVVDELNDSRIYPVIIPLGRNEEEIWQIFDIVINQVEPGDTVIFDITHGLRSLPFLVFLFAAYLKYARNVNIEAILYGAFELGDRKNDLPAPVLDLSRFVDMLDWLTATDQFTESGNAYRLVSLLRDSLGKNHPVPTTLETVSQTALTAQPFSLMESIPTLVASLEKADQELAREAPPFHLLKAQILNEIRPFEADFEEDEGKAIAAEFAMIEWYHTNRQYIQAVSLAREWLLDAVTHHLGDSLDFDRKPRERIERGVSGIAMLGNKKQSVSSPADLNEYGVQMVNELTPEELQLVKEIWNLLQPIRNSFDHPEHQTGSIQWNRSIFNWTEKVLPKIRQLHQNWFKV